MDGTGLVLVATILALTAAGLHAGWNLAAKRSIDPFIALWGQFLIAAGIALVLLVVTRTLPGVGWRWAAVSGAVHLPYIVALARAYEVGDFSLAYPLARGGGALLAGIGGILLLGDAIDAWSGLAIVVIAGGMAMLAIGADRHQVAVALFVACTIGIYTVVDSHAAREVDDITYTFASFVATGILVSAYGVATGRRRQLTAVLPTQWRRFTVTGVMSMTTYALVLLAVQRAPVGYVAALRESSVLIAAFVGWRYLDEGSARRRSVAAAVIVGGLVLLVVSG